MSWPTRSELKGVRVALLEARMGGELAALISRYGGIPHSVPALREAPVQCARHVSSLIDRVQRPGRHVVVFLTGVGARALFREAEQLGRLPSLVDALRRATVVCRGPKPTAVLNRCGVGVGLPVDEPYTSAELLSALEKIDLQVSEVTLVHYGERNDALVDALVTRGARLEELCLYEWRLPEETGPLGQLIYDLIDGRFHALVLTSQIQFRHLVHVAAGLSLDGRLLDRLRSDIVVAAIGPTCKSAIEAYGIVPQVVPENPKMGPLVASLAEYFSRSR